ncbi:patatin-like phospholipase family protein (plasmid) [Kovacikia minuta CCNUW1]|uniref:patatin-like phospholipase family protein n=1 Tax=Kovacikia minuta TaxID=2931930 RepID=UPI001CCC0BDA|nr:patatin-like phospholipase family protein [Kovacikia minuta]UBF30394.1 patatin-like phospholipase family protein [Kovacikia minuta CCNUW1]
MTKWNPSNVFAQNEALRLTNVEKALIQRKLPQAEDGNFYADAVFEGGGVKGTAFLGALRCFDDAGVKFRKVAGTSAGAITAAMLAADFSLDELEEIIGQLDYMSDLLSKKTSPFILNGSPHDDLKHPIPMLVNLLLVGQQGQYSSKPFLHWLQKNIDSKIPSFKSFNHSAGVPWYRQRELRVVISDISQGAMRVLPTDLNQYGESPDTFNVAEAVRLSMSIPFFFEPGKLGESMIVDGGILSNFPLWIYDAPERQRPKCPTFGFQLVEKPESTKPIKSPIDLFMGMLNTMQAASDRRYLATNEQARVIRIGTMGVATTQFNLTNDEKSSLYKEGYEKAKTFLLQQWSWEAHLAARGFAKTEAAPELLAA